MIAMDRGFEYSIARLAEGDNLDEVAALEAASFANPWSRETLARELRNHDVVRVYVLRTGDQLVGFCGCWLITDELHIHPRSAALQRGGAEVVRRFRVRSAWHAAELLHPPC